jgi:outer membrane protein assembly factor BamD
MMNPTQSSLKPVRPSRRGAAVLMLLGAAVLLLGAGPDREGVIKNLRTKFRQSRSKDTVIKKDLRPVEEIFADAEAHDTGRETWYGRMVNATFGEDSKAYKKLPGVHRQNLTKAKNLYKQVVDNYPFSSLAPVAELRVADCHYKLEEYEEASVWYDQFIKKHGRREEVPYAMFRAGMCQFERVRKPGRDQQHSHEAELAFQLLIDRFPDSPYAADAKVKLAECQLGLARHELLVADYYYKNKEYWSAAARYNGVWKNYPGVGLDQQAMLKEAKCYEKLGKADLARPLYERIGQSPAPDNSDQKARGWKRLRDRKKP